MVNRILIFVWIFSFAFFARGEVTAFLDRAEIFLDETVTFTIRQKGDNQAGNTSPDLKVLSKDFFIVSSQQQVQTSILNSNVEKTITWIYQLRGKKPGTFPIPQITVGGKKTPPLAINIKNPSERPKTPDNQSPVLVEMETVPLTPYVQQPVIITVRLFLRETLVNGNLSEPFAPNTTLERMGGDKRYTRQKNGRNWSVIERQFRLIPLNSGNITLSPIEFQGVTQNQGSRRRVDAKSQPATLNVKPRPNDFKGRWWLPAENLQINDQWSHDLDQIRVGDSITRTINLRAQGLVGEQLPNLLDEQKMPKTITFYPEQPKLSTRGNRVLTATREETYAMIFTQEGDVTLPEIRILWWNVKGNKMEEAILPARTITILPSENEEALSVSTTASEAPSTVIEVRENPLFLWWAIVASGGWVLTIFIGIFFYWRLLKGEEKPEKARYEKPLPLPKKAIEKALSEKQWHDAATLILKWGKKNHGAHSLCDLAEKIDDEQAKQALETLDAMLYGGKNEGNFDGKTLLKALANISGDGETEDAYGLKDL